MTSWKFQVATPLGFTVRMTENYWQRLLEKHPDLFDKECLVKQALTTPLEVRRSSRDSNVLLFYIPTKV
ncbi:gsl1613 [Gloeobacter violaceus PCC 7421]|uniref:Gsl1613 protein n=1 Tax=Gloeobacter violaceus (strain ATCC 29082 / PCC 7421) TaxID=251221 RepID=Q7NK67_GLOVI|nr:gsl1613 [Gloeobacter violaceus PCC 7421]